MTKIIAISNQKGGVGKTTTSINLAASLAVTKHRVLLIDLDPQGNATMGSGVDKNNLSYSAAEVLLNQVPLLYAILQTEVGFDLLPSNQDLTVAEVALMQMPDREQRLSNALKKIVDNYHYVIIDCPPALTILTLNALVAADSVLIPMQCEYYALEGLASLVETIEQVRMRLNSKLNIEGILRTMYDGRNRLTLDVSQQLHQYFPDRVYRTVIPRNVRLAEAPSHGLPVILYDKRSQGAEAYLALAGEMIRKQTTPLENAELRNEK